MELELDPTDPHHVAILEQKAFQGDPIGLIRAGYLKIKTKDGDIVPFKPKRCQIRILEKIQEKRKQGLPVRGLILKTRQTGISTLCEAILFSFCSQRGASQGLVMADDEEGASDIFKMTETFYESMQGDHPHLTPQRRRSDERRVEFHNKKSGIRIETANNKRAGRKYTYRYAHLTEVAFYPNLFRLLAGLLPSIPDRPETILLMESTANGLNDFHRIWQEKKKLEKEGKTEWFLVFIPWSEDEDCIRYFVDDAQRMKFQESMTSDEIDLMKRHTLSLEQLNWRRHTLEDLYNGDLVKFNQEFPLTEKDAFATTSRRVFPDRLTSPQSANIQKPKHSGEIDIMERRPIFLPDAKGFLKIFKEPMPEWKYVIGADACESAVSHDEACAQVIARDTWEQVAHMHGHMDPTEFAKRLFALAMYYNWALLAPEVNGPGAVTVAKLSEMFYPNMCMRQKSVITNAGQWEESEEFGFHTNPKTKPQIIENLGNCLRDLLMIVHDETTHSQLETYVIKKVNEEGYVTTGAEEGMYDDCVMALAIAAHFARQMRPSHGGSSREVARPNTMNGRSGYG